MEILRTLHLNVYLLEPRALSENESEFVKRKSHFKGRNGESRECVERLQSEVMQVEMEK